MKLFCNAFRLIAMAFLGLLTCLRADGRETSTAKCAANATLQEKQTFGDFEIRLSHREYMDSCIQIIRKGHTVFSKHSGGRFVIGNDINKNLGGDIFHPQAIPIGTDITGRGLPNLIFTDWSGGAHCCFTFHVVELGDQVKEIAAIPADDSDYAHFEDILHDGKYEFVGYDYTFAYWKTGFGQSPAPRIVLRFNGSHYVLATDLMRQDPPPNQSLNAKATEVLGGDWKQNSPPPALWGTMLDLIYTGNSELAWKFFSDAWPRARASSKKSFLHNFCGQLAASRYFSQLRSTIKDAPCTFDRRYASVE